MRKASKEEPSFFMKKVLKVHMTENATNMLTKTLPPKMFKLGVAVPT
ncbi:hypothetical protein LINPERPRIM_LOCUS548 [Linum perenne]